MLLFVTIAFLSGTAIAQAAEPIPFKEFISITEKVLDALDEIEVVFSNSNSTKIEVKQAFKKLDTEMLKYRRYVKDWRKSPGKQADIIKAIATANIDYEITELKGIYDKSHEEAKLATQEARELFMRYKKRSK
jgi:hypothetical protein